MISILSFCALLFIIDKCVDATNTSTISTNSSTVKRTARDSNLATAIVNSQVLTILNYQNNQVYIYGALSNENENRLTPEKWVFYFVPLMLPITINNFSDQWVYIVGQEIRMSLILSNDDIQDLVRSAIMKKYDLNTAKYYPFWDVAPLMIDYLVAYIVRGTNLPVEGIPPFKLVHPNQLTMTFQFRYASENNAKEVVEKLLSSEYQVEIAFYFAGFKQVSTNLMSVTSDQLRSILSKTVADGQSNNAQYIHRRQSASFVSQYTTNVQKLIYIESTDTNLSSSIASLEAQFTLLMQQSNIIV